MKKLFVIVIALTLVLSLSGLSSAATTPVSKTGVYYEIFVRSFYDTNNDGIGDLNGVTKKLDYLADLGVKGIWLMPITVSPSYHGYDTVDYYNIDPDYGTIEDLTELTKQAKKRNIKVIMDLVVNHTGTGHPWFEDASTNPDSYYRDWYTFAGENDDTSDQSAAGSGDAWHTAATGRYVGTFWSGMPDLNFDNPKVRAEMINVGKFWLGKGVSGFRLDAAKHIYEDFNYGGTYKENANKKSVAWWKEFRAALKTVNKNVYLVGEVWDSASVVGPYLNNALDSGFNFDLGNSIVSAAADESDPGIGYTVSNILDYFKRVSGGTFIDAPFLRNHDQNRVMSELGGDVNKAKMAASMLLTLPGNPFIYYGEEIGMQGMKPDESIRTPFIWSSTNTTGQTTAMDGYTDQEAYVNEAAQAKNVKSLRRHYEIMIKWRNSDYTLSDGSISEYIVPDSGIAAWVRTANKKNTLVLHNLTSKTKTINLNTSDNTLKFKYISRFTVKGAKLVGNKLTIPAYSTISLKQ